MAEFIVDTINSILCQSIKNFEIIVIDDGSTDETRSLLDQYFSDVPLVKILTIKNGGVSHARRVGVEAAKGQYITFVDPDDRVGEKYLESLIKPFLDHSNLLISAVRFTQVSNFNSIIYKWSQHYQLVSVDDAAQQFYFQLNGVAVSVWGKMFKANTFRENTFRDGIIFEDLELLTRILANATSNDVIALNASIQYSYFQRSKSIMHATFNPADLDIIQVGALGIEALKENSKIRDFFLDKMITGTWQVLIRSANSKNAVQAQRQLQSSLRKYGDIRYLHQISRRKTEIIVAFSRLPQSIFLLIVKFFGCLQGRANHV